MLPSIGTSQAHTISTTGTEASYLDFYIQEILVAKVPFQTKRQVADKFHDIDSLKFFYIIKELEKELGYVKLENIILYDFLEKNDPKYLIGLKKTLEERNKLDGKAKQKIHFSDKTATSLHSLHKPLGTTGSVASLTSNFSNYNKQSEQHSLNFNIKTEICEKYFVIIKKQFDKTKAQSISHIKFLRAKIDELNFLNDEIRGTTDSFQHVVVNLGLDRKSGKIPAEKFMKFFSVWNKNAMTLISNLRLKIQSLHEQCHKLKLLIIKKADLSGMLGPADFEQMQIKKNTYTKELEDRNVQLIKIKYLAGKASSALAAQRNVLFHLETQLKRINGKIIESNSSSIKMDNEIIKVKSEIEKVENNIDIIEDKMMKYEAPDIAQYIEQNRILYELERKEKLLKRQVGILTLKLKNVKIKIMQQKQKK